MGCCDSPGTLPACESRGARGGLHPSRTLRPGTLAVPAVPAQSGARQNPERPRPAGSREAARRGGLSMRTGPGRLSALEGSDRSCGPGGCAGVCGTCWRGCCTPLRPAPSARPSAPACRPRSASVGKRSTAPGPRGPRVTVVWSSGCKVVIQHLKRRRGRRRRPSLCGSRGPGAQTAAFRPLQGPEGRLAGRERGALLGDDGAPRAGEGRWGP